MKEHRKSIRVTGVLRGNTFTPPDMREEDPIITVLICSKITSFVFKILCSQDY